MPDNQVHGVARPPANQPPALPSPQPLDGLFKQFWGESSEIDKKMAEMFDRLSRDKDYLLLAAKQNDVLVGFCMGVV